MFNLTSPSEASRRATKRASRVVSSLRNTLRSTFSKKCDQRSKEQKPKYRLCSKPSITITDTETGEEWEFVDHDELDGDLANSDDNRTLREELEMNAREQDDLLNVLPVRRNSPLPVEQEISQDVSMASRLIVYNLHLMASPNSHSFPSFILDITRTFFRSATNTNLPTPNSNLSLDPLHHYFYAIPRDLRLTTSAYTSELNPFTRQPTTQSPGLLSYDNTNTPPYRLNRHHGMFSLLVKKVTNLVKGTSQEEMDRDLKENTIIQPEDAIEPWEVLPNIKDDPWSVVVESRGALSQFDDGNEDRQSHFERTYQYEFDRQVVAADRAAMREAKMRASKWMCPS
ncbi:hypothetical protein FGADI_9128 [Fusarium gaditjirri]|uniref:Uncharacterized protein n=1 Tax=Fusarium gaditjirri TaxID=282569 RepID=A0A8H4T0S3_9HYPO|nr:hypothetical protein FGADI_9128 [Fusarium gaditjirri]